MCIFASCASPPSPRSGTGRRDTRHVKDMNDKNDYKDHDQEAVNFYELAPSGYSLCLRPECASAHSCLRHLAGLNIPADVPTVRCVSPSAWPEDAAKCPHYRTTQKVTLAWGASHMAEEVPYKQAVAIRNAVRRLWPKTTYFRISHHERPITPDMQRKIDRIFARLAPEAHPRYDCLTEEYDFL